MIDKILKDIKGLFKVQDKVKFLKQNIPYLAFFYIGNIFSHHVRAYIGGDIIDKIFQGILEINTMSFLPSLHPTDIIMGVVVAVLIKFIVYTKGVRCHRGTRFHVRCKYDVSCTPSLLGENADIFADKMTSAFSVFSSTETGSEYPVLPASFSPTKR